MQVHTHTCMCKHKPSLIHMPKHIAILPTPCDSHVLMFVNRCANTTRNIFTYQSNTTTYSDQSFPKRNHPAHTLAMAQPQNTHPSQPVSTYCTHNVNMLVICQSIIYGVHMGNISREYHLSSHCWVWIHLQHCN